MCRVDPETGESNKEHPKLQEATEPETGEPLLCAPIDSETGEQQFLKIRKRKFRVPKEYTYYVPEKKMPFKSSERRIEFLTAVMFLVPSMIFFYPVFWLPIILTELVFHKVCHMKNMKLEGEKKTWFSYKSPLHVISKEFCWKCKEESTNSKISQIQDMRHDRLRRYGLDIRNVVT